MRGLSEGMRYGVGHIARRSLRLAIGAGLAIGLIVAPSANAEYPDRPIKVLITAAPGAATDITARTVAEQMSKILKQPVIIENQAGGGGNIALGAVARAARLPRQGQEGSGWRFAGQRQHRRTGVDHDREAQQDG